MASQILRLPIGIKYPLEDQPLFRGLDQTTLSSQGVSNQSLPIVDRHFIPPLSESRAVGILTDFNQYLATLDQIKEGSIEYFGSKLVGLAKLHSLGLPTPSIVGIGSPLVSRLFEEAETRSLLLDYLPYVVRTIELETSLQYQSRGLTCSMSFGNPDTPLFLIVRSGAKRVIEGLLPTLQYVGLNDQTVWGLASLFQDPKRAHELYRQYLIEYACMVMGLVPSIFSKIKSVNLSDRKFKLLERQLSTTLRDVKKTRVEKRNIVRSVVHLVAEIEAIKGIVRQNTSRRSFPQDPYQQLSEAILAIARSWNDEQIVDHRERHGMRSMLPAAIAIQRQEHGKFTGTTSGAGIVFSSDPTTGMSRDPQSGSPIGWAKFSSTGDEVMSGYSAVSTHRERRSQHQRVSLRHLLFRLDRSEVELIKNGIDKVKWDARRPMKIEVIVNQGKVWFVQGSPAQLTPLAMVRTLVDWKNEQNQPLQERRMLSQSEMRKLTEELDLWDVLSQPQYERPTQGHFLLTGISHFPGAVQGPAVLDYRSVLSRQPKQPVEKEYIFIIDTIDDPREWSEIFLRAKGIVFRREPGMHFLQRAIDEKVPVIVATEASLITEGLKSIKPKTPVIFDSTRSDGFVTQDLDLPLREGVTARFVRDLLSRPMGADEVSALQQPPTSRREAGNIQYIWDYFQMVPPFQASQFLSDVLPGNVEEILERVVHYEQPIPRLMPLRELVIKREWVVDDGSESSPMDYELNSAGKEFFKLFFEKDPAMLADLLLRAMIGEHDFAIEIFRSLSRQQQIQLMNSMVHAAMGKNLKPGWACGIFLLSRFLAVIVRDTTDIHNDLHELNRETLMFLIREMFIFDLNVHPRKCQLDIDVQKELRKYSLAASKSATMVRRITKEEDATTYLRQRWHRYPGMNAGQWMPALEQHPEISKVLENLSPPFRLWWDELRNLI